jgi:hypothetical protein
LFVRLENVPSAAVRKAIVKTRTAFDADPQPLWSSTLRRNPIWRSG